MPVYRSEDCDVLASMTTPGFEFAREIAQAEGIDLGLAMLGPAENAPAAVLLQMPPGHVLERHAHDAYRVEIVIRGSVIMPDGSVLKPGDMSLSAPMEFYGPLTAGPDGSLSVEIFGSAAGLAPVPADDGGVAADVAGRVLDAMGRDTDVALRQHYPSTSN